MEHRHLGTTGPSLRTAFADRVLPHWTARELPYLGRRQELSSIYPVPAYDRETAHLIENSANSPSDRPRHASHV